MENIAIATVSSKGQLVIPSEMRQEYPAGEKVILIKGRDNLLMKRVSSLSKNLKEDMEFAIRTEKAWQEIDEGKSTEMSFEEFVRQLKK